MSKELTALEIIKKLLKGYESSVEPLDIIETALKDYETYKIYICDEFREFVYKNDFKSVKNIELAFYSLIKRNNTLKKENEKLKKQITEKNEVKEKLKALQIIKEKTQYFIDFDESTKTIYIDCALDCDNQEYDLLKEVLI